MKRSDNKRKSDSHEETTVVNISTDETGEPGLDSRIFGEPCVDSHTCEEPVESIPQAEFKSPSEYVMMVMKAHKDRQFTSNEFMQATGLSKCITDTFWTALYKRPDLYVYVTEDIINSEDLIKFDNFDFNFKYYYYLCCCK